jgi:hypothetical protein
VLDWIERARRRDPGDLHLLLERFAQMFERGQKHQIVACFDELAQWRDDPRIGGRLERASKLAARVEALTREFAMFNHARIEIVAASSERPWLRRA